MQAPKILIVEDDQYLGMMVQELLESRDFEARWSTDGKAGYDQFVAFSPDLCILDINMPEKDGFALAQEIRAVDRKVPIVFLTAKSMKEDVLKGFKLGADDYIKKPFSMEELIMRINAILRRVGVLEDEEEEQTIFTIGQYQYDHVHRSLKLDQQQVVLPNREADLLRLLCLSKNQLLEREYALKKLWGDDSYFNARSMDVYITNIRKKLKEDPTIQIVNIRGRGYKLMVLDGEPFGA